MTPLEYLFGLEFHGIKLGLENIIHLLAKAGDPQLAYPSVHVAGTNGKGSVVAMLDAVFRAAGYATGRFTSPHLCDVRERFLVNGELISPGELDAEIEYFRAIGEEMGHSPTFFELNTAIAFRHFARRGADVALVEVGMGGRFDSTNVLTPKAAAITNIALEHTKYLGDTVEAIAFEKAGIIKAGVPVVVGEPEGPAREVILARARELGSPALVVGRDFTYALESGDAWNQRLTYRGSGLTVESARMGLPGAYQAVNGALVCALVEVLREDFPKLDEAALVRGLAGAKWPCRLERVLREPPVIVDVSHNPAGMEALVAALGGPCVGVLAVASDKDGGAMAEEFARVAEPLILTVFDGPRAMPLDKLASEARARGVEARLEPNLAEAIAAGITRASARRPLVIAGSLFTAGQAREILERDYGAAGMVF